MATWKFTAKRGGSPDKVTIGAGTAIAGGNAVEVNVDATTMTQAEFFAALDDIKLAAAQTKFPAL